MPSVAVHAAQQRARCVELVSQGWRYDDIAREVGDARGTAVGGVVGDHLDRGRLGVFLVTSRAQNREPQVAHVTRPQPHPRP